MKPAIGDRVTTYLGKPATIVDTEAEAPEAALMFELDVSRVYRNKEGYEAGGYKTNTSFKTETHTPESFVETVLREGYPFTMKHAKRSPEETGAAARGVTTPKHKENFISAQILVGDDDHKETGGAAWWLGDDFFSRHGFAFAESASSTPERQKGHAIFLFDRPITDAALYKECLQALCSYYPRLDWLVNVDRTIYSAQGAPVHLLGNICPFAEFEREVLAPHRADEAEKRAALEARQAQRRAEYERARARGATVSQDQEERYLAGFLDWLFRHVADTARGDNRNRKVYWAGREIAGVEASTWAQPYLHLLSDVDARIVEAATANGYLDEHANGNADEVLRVFNRGRLAGGEPIDPPMPRVTAGPNGSGLAASAGAQAGDDGQARTGFDSGLPVIIVNHQHLRDVSDNTYRVLVSANQPPVVFQYGGALARVVDAGGRPIVQHLNADSLRHRLERVASFSTSQVTNAGQILKPSGAPERLVADILAYPEWGDIPALEGIVTAPVVAPSGQVRVRPGYDAETRLVYRPIDDLDLGSTEPTPARLEWAKEMIGELLHDFPFSNDASKANAIALMLLPFARPLIDGCTPLHAITAPKEGTGKGLLSDVLTRPFHPDGPQLMVAGTDEDEWRKRITSSLLGGTSHILIDNIKAPLVSGSLAAVLTRRLWTDRILGQTRNITLENRQIWIATGNNIAIDSELARRCCWIKLDANEEKPWLRAEFRHPNLLEWGRLHRSDLVTAALVLIRNWFAKGQPAGKRVVGSFEAWARVMGGILDAAGISAFMDNADELYENADPANALWAAFVAEWWKQFKEKEVGVVDLFPLADSEPAEGQAGQGLLDEQLGGGSPRSRKTRLGKLLGQRVDQVIGGYKIEKAGEWRRASRYNLRKLGKEA